ncbi:putative peripheral protein of the cytosolic face of the mitochondrial outer membrane [Naematelia encephala]|uniref:Putative peripheral protein of the cytosolic face of the mitochondrial outer membrane n=1 Tax=Naematelia encephala TaxID=71784 RepID=A0A1Y2BHT0_9TREE|nr:putative peripheral protein of the cytosolic face of the mitochondrial outer membrane [Naematelia encephala]
MSRNDRDVHGRPLRQALDPISAPYIPSLNSTLSIAKEVLMGPFQSEHRRSESLRILSDLAPSLMHPKFLNAATNSSSSRGLGRPQSRPASPYPLLRLPTALPSSLSNMQNRQTSNSLAILENVDRLANLSLDGVQRGFQAEPPSLIRGFKATIPSSELPKQRRRMIRGGLVDEDLGGQKIGLKKLGDQARGLLTEGQDQVDPESSLDVGRRSKKRRKARESRRKSEGRHLEGKLHMEDLLAQADEIVQDKDNLQIRTALIHSEIYEVSAKIDALEEIRRRLEASLLHLQEEQLELDDELEGVQELMASPAVTSAAGTKALPSSATSAPKSSRRRKGPAFLPSEHDELPPGVAFMTLTGHSAPITALDYTEPYGMLVTAGQDDVVKVWDLCDGEEIGQLRGHTGTVKAVQVEDTLCLTGGADGNIRLWDLRIVEDYEDRLQRSSEEAARRDPLQRILEHDEAEEFEWEEGPSGYSHATTQPDENGGPCVRTLEGHSKSVTALYYEDGCLVTGSSDKTIRQWDVATGQCVLTMDILWAISNPPMATPAPTTTAPPRLLHRSSTSFGSIHYDDILPSPGASLVGMTGSSLLQAVTSAHFAVPTPPYADGTWEMYQDFVGGVQFWGYALASGSGDGGVRMWDMRTGQAHRTLVGHTAPVTCLQFDEHSIVTGSLDKTIRIWDIRTGTVAETHRYEYPVTALQFDSRKVVACTGENGVEVYNRTTHAHSRLVVNGHTKPAERMRFIDKYLVSGGRDGCAKVWAM